MTHVDRASLRTALPFATVLLVVLAGFVLIGLYHWRWGSTLIGGGLLIAALLRGILGREQMGLLALRSKPVDVLLYGGFGAIMIVVALTITGGPLG
ncbi:DUF3017 domain-containing protein [Sciscionella sediminilitoris]|uniref:DUF3017 domain-containing protein n=1 Tax=Sciscionella sediminilitoris TaxID=1445613 RepID=UPI0004DEE787|nr:DUF3017 domain-containing protein [Sciscionella sp. SE31]